MEKSKVYFTDFRTANGVGLPELVPVPLIR